MKTSLSNIFSLKFLILISRQNCLQTRDTTCCLYVLREVPAVYILSAAKEIWWYVFSAVYSSPFSYFLKFFLPSYIFQIYNKTLQCSELMPKRSLSIALLRKKENAKILACALDKICIIFVIL